ncbi:Holliday junction ATP-dependent DNA helicase RuvB, partial [Clarias magur]
DQGHPRHNHARMDQSPVFLVQSDIMAMQHKSTNSPDPNPIKHPWDAPDKEVKSTEAPQHSKDLLES